MALGCQTRAIEGLSPRQPAGDAFSLPSAVISSSGPSMASLLLPAQLWKAPDVEITPFSGCDVY